MAWRSLFNRRNEACHLVRSAGAARRPSLEALEARRLLSTVPLDGTWGGILAGFEMSVDTGEPFVENELFSGVIAGGIFDALFTYFDDDLGELAQESGLLDAMRTEHGRLDLLFTDEYDEILHTQGGVDPNSLVGWARHQGEYTEDGGELFQYDETMYLLRAPSDAQASDVIGVWDFSALNITFDVIEGEPDPSTMHGILEIAADGTFTITDVQTAEGPGDDVLGTWTLAPDGRLDLFIEDPEGGDADTELVGLLGDMGSALVFGDLFTNNGNLVTGFAVKNDGGATADDVAGDWRITRTAFTAEDELAHEDQVLLLHLDMDGTYGIFNLDEIDAGADPIEPVQTGQWSVTDGGYFETFNRSNDRVILDGQFDSTFSILAIGDTDTTGDGTVGLSFGTRAGADDIPDDPPTDLPFTVVDELDPGFPGFASNAVTATGDVIVTWTDGDETEGLDVFARLLAPDGTPVGDVFTVNTTTVGMQGMSSVAVDGDGGFIITWMGENTENGTLDVYARRFDAAGSPVGDEFVVANTDGDEGHVDVAMNAMGDFVITWTTGDETAGVMGVVAQAFDPAGTPIGSPFAVEGDALVSCFASSVSMNDAGGFVVTWMTGGYFDLFDFTMTGDPDNPDGPDGPPEPPAVWVQALGVGGTPMGDAIDVDPANPSLGPADVGLAGDGSFVVVWETPAAAEGDPDDPDFDDSHIVAHRFGADGASLGETLLVSPGAPGFNLDPSIAIDSSGAFVVVWVGSFVDEFDVEHEHVFLRDFMPDGTPTTDSVLLTHDVPGIFELPTAATNADGALNVAFTAMLGGEGNDTLIGALTFAAHDFSAYPTVPDVDPNDPDDPMNMPELPWIIVDDLQPGFPGLSSVANDGQGNFVVTWMDTVGDGDSDIFAAVFGFYGEQLVAPFTVNTTTAGFQGFSSVAMNEAGEFVITWTSENAAQTDFDVYAQRFSSSFLPVGGEMVVNTTTEGDQDFSDVAINNGGGFVITWTSATGDPEDPTIGVYAQEYDADGTAVDAELNVSETIDGTNFHSHVAVNDFGNFVIIWTNDALGTIANNGFGDDGPYDPHAPDAHVHAPGALYNRVYDKASPGLLAFRVDTDFDIVGRAGVTIDQSGAFIVVWTGIPDPADFDGENYSFPTVIAAQVFDADGTGNGVFELSDGEESHVFDPSVDVGTDGTFVASWTHLRYHPDDTWEHFIEAGAFNTDGSVEEYPDCITHVDAQDFFMSNQFSSITVNSFGEIAVSFTTFFGTAEGEGAVVSAMTFEDDEFGDDDDDFFDMFKDMEGDAMPSIAADADGNFVLTWTRQTDETVGPDVFMQLFDNEGVATTDPVLVNDAITAGPQYMPIAAMNDDGEFVIVWTSHDEEADDSDIYGRLYGADGAPIGDAFVISTSTEGYQELPKVAMDAEGGFVVTWTNEDEETWDERAYARRFDATGAPVGLEFQVGTGEDETCQFDPVAAVADDGSFVIVWAHESWATDEAAVYGQRFDATGTALADPLQVSAIDADWPDVPDIAMNGDGGFVVVWAQEPDEEGFDVFARQYDADGTALGDPFQINTTTEGDQDMPAVAMDADGGFIVTWSNIPADAEGDLDADAMMRRFDAAGNPVTGEMMLEYPDAPGESNGLVDVAAAHNGGFIVAWTNINPELMTASVFHQVFAGEGGWSILADTDNTIEIDEGDELTIPVTVVNEPDDGLTYIWDFGDGFGANTLAAPHTYADDDTYTVTFTAIDSDLNEVTKTFTVEVANVAPTVDAGDDQAGEQGDVFAFTATATDPGEDDLAYTWDFGDGSTTTGSTASHVYATADNYIVTLTVDDGDGGITTDTLTVTVNAVAPDVDAGPDQTVNEGDQVILQGFADVIGDDPITYTWDFGDDSDPESGVDLTSVTHAYALAGDYTVTLTAAVGDVSSTDTLVVSVLEAEVVIPDAPTAPRLLGASDTGDSNSDGVTSRTSDAGLQFRIEGVQAGATVTLYANGTAVATGTAGGSAITLTVTAGLAEDGEYNISATQTVADVESSHSEQSLLVIDTTAPAPAPAPDLADESDSGLSNSDNITSLRTLTFTGTAEPGTTVRLLRAGQATGAEAVAGENGEWTVTITSVATGIADWTVRQTDLAGNVQSDSGSLTVNVVRNAPARLAKPALLASDDTGTSDSDGLTSFDRVTIVGTAEPGNLVTLYDETEQTIGMAYADDNGAWQIITDEFADGQHDLRATQTDATSTESLPSAPLRIVIDTIAPEPAAPQLRANKNNDTGTSDSDGITSNTTPTIIGTGAERGATITVYDDAGDEIGSTTARSNGSWTLTPTVPFTDGIHFITVVQSDAAGNESDESDPLELVIDTTPPDPTDAPDLTDESDTGLVNDDDITASQDLTFTGVAEPGATIELLRDGKNAKAQTVADEITGEWTLTVTNVKDGAAPWIVKQTDAAGNIQETGEALTVTVITKAPAAPGSLDLVDADDTGASDHDNLTSQNTPTITGTGVVGSTVTLYDTDGTTELGTAEVEEDGTWSITTTELADGEHMLRTSQSDVVGNTSKLSRPLKVGIDTEAPAPDAPALKPGRTNDTGASDSDGITSNPRPIFIGTGAERGATVTLLDQHGTALGTTIAKSNGSWQIQPAADVATGLYTFTVTQTDAAGNESLESEGFDVDIDVTPPDPADAPDLTDDSDTGLVNDDDITASQDLTFTGAAEPGATIELLRDGRTTRAQTVADEITGEWTLTVINVKDGAAQWTVKQTDAAGNIQETGDALTVTVITKAPASPGSLDLVDADDTGAFDHDNLTSENAPTITGTGVVGSTVTLYDTDGTTELGTAEVEEDGTWSITTTELADGEHMLRASQSDAVGNTSKLSRPMKVEIDTDAPAPDAPALRPGKTNDTGASDSDGITSNPRPVFIGTGAERGATVTLLDQNATPLGTTTANGNGIWQIQPAADLPTGLYTFAVTQTDVAGNESIESDGFDVEIDVTPPDPADAPDLAPESDTGVSDSDDVTASRTLIFTGAAEAGAEVQLQRSGRAFGPKVVADEVTGEWMITVTNAPKGVTNWSIQQTDVAGNVQTQGDTLAVNVSLAKPPKVTGLDLAAADDTGVSDSDNVTNQTELQIAGTAIAGNAVTLVDSDGTQLGTAVAGENGAWSITTTALADGLHQLRAVQTDLVGNVSAPSSPLKVTVDTQATAPTDMAMIASRRFDTGRSTSDGITANAQTMITGNGAEKGALITITDQNSTVIGTTTARGNGSWKFTPAAPMADGAYELTATQTDKAGNVSDAGDAINIVIDTIAPDAAAAPDLAVASDDGDLDDDNITSLRDLTFTGIAEAGALIQLVRDGSRISESIIVGENGAWSITVTGIKTGAADWWIIQTDVAGNEQQVGDTLTVTVTD